MHSSFDPINNNQYNKNMIKKRDSKKRIAFSILIEGSKKFAEAPSQIHLVPCGEWAHPAYGPMKITPENISEFVQNFRDKVRLDLPITAGHDNGMSGGELPAIGWIEDLIDGGDRGLFGDIKWTEAGKQALSDGSFKYFSPEFYEVYEDPETGRIYNHVLVGGALTNKPYFKELDPVATFSEPSIISQFNDTTTMDLTTILAKDVTTLTDEEKAFVREHKDELTDEQKETAKDVLGDAADAGAGDDKAGADAGAGADDGAGAGDGAGDDKGADEGAGTDPVNASEKGKKVTMSEAEVAALKSAADKGAKAFSELETMKLDAHVSKMIFSESNKDGKFLSTQKTAIVGFLKSLSEKQRDQFTNIINSMPKFGVAFKEIGADAGASKNVLGQIEEKVQAKIKASEGTKKVLSYSEALKVILKENPDLAKAYSEGTE